MWGTDLYLFFFPVHCLVCGKKLFSPRAVLCLDCEFNLPKSGFDDPVNNPVCRIFWGRIPVEMGTSLFQFEKGSGYQSLLHELKYRGNRRAGIFLGKMLGREILYSAFSSCDIIIPVPIHAKRLRERGYNQSEIIANGISLVTGIPVVSDLIMRTSQLHSQTTMSRYERFRNVSGNFRLCKNPPDVNGKKILLIDDVVTTGSTLEACCVEILYRFNCLICIATVSHA